MATAWPNVVGWLITTLPTLPGWSTVEIYDGNPAEGDFPDDYVTVGYSGNDQAGSYTLTPDDDGFSVQEAGTVRSQLVCATDGVDAAGARVRLFVLVDALNAKVRADRTLGGVLSAQGTVDLAVDVESIQNPTGTAAFVSFTLSYYTVT